MKLNYIDFEPNDLAKSDMFWKAWIKNRENLHPDTVKAIRTQWQQGECSLILPEELILKSKGQHETKTTVELELTVGFDVEKEEPQTQDYPGAPASLEIIELRLGEIVLPSRIFEEVIEEHADTLEETCWEALAEYPMGKGDPNL